jgi:hypothetical protein
MARELRERAAAAQSPRENAMRPHHLLLLSSIALSTPALAAEQKQTADTHDKPRIESKSRTDPAKNSGAGEETIQNHASRKNRVHHTFPPPAKRM